MNPYTVLDLDPSATLDQIKARYKEYAVQFHPDKCKSSDDMAKEYFKVIHEAYQILLKQKRETNVPLEDIPYTEDNPAVRVDMDSFLEHELRTQLGVRNPKDPAEIQERMQDPQFAKRFNEIFSARADKIAREFDALRPETTQGHRELESKQDRSIEDLLKEREDLTAEITPDFFHKPTRVTDVLDPETGLTVMNNDPIAAAFGGLFIGVDDDNPLNTWEHNIKDEPLADLWERSKKQEEDMKELNNVPPLTEEQRKEAFEAEMKRANIRAFEAQEKQRQENESYMKLFETVLANTKNLENKKENGN